MIKEPVRSIHVGGNHYDTREMLAHAAEQARQRNYSDFLIVDADAHHYENEVWGEIIKYIEDPVIRHYAEAKTEIQARGIGATGGMLPTMLGNQENAGRITRHMLRKLEKGDESGRAREVVLVRRAMDSMGIDTTIIFPTPMLFLGIHPQIETEVALARAYAHWITKEILPQDDGIKTMLYLPFNDPEACLKMVEEFSHCRGVVGFMVTSVRYRPVHHNMYVKVYRALEERDMPIAFHAAYSWQDRSMEQLNRFMTVHAIGFTQFNIIHLTNWVINGIPERFPKLRTLWIESGLAWIPFLMQRLDHEFMLRPSEAPLLKKKPSDYMREMFYTTQPMEVTDMRGLQTTFEMMNAESQLLYASDYPHWDFDLPSTIYDLPFLSEQAKRNILGENARRFFQLDKK